MQKGKSFCVLEIYTFYLILRQQGRKKVQNRPKQGTHGYRLAAIPIHMKRAKNGTALNTFAIATEVGQCCERERLWRPCPFVCGLISSQSV